MLKRTHTCGDLTAGHAGQEVILNGWVDTRRDHGGLVFIDLRDRFGITQVVFDPGASGNEALREAAQTLRNEFVIGVSFEEKPQNRVIAVGKTGDSRPFPTTPLSQAASGESLQLDAIMGIQCMDSGVVWMLDNGRRSELPPKVVAWDSAHSRLQRVFNLAPQPFCQVPSWMTWSSI